MVGDQVVELLPICENDRSHLLPFGVGGHENLAAGVGDTAPLRSTCARS